MAWKKATIQLDNGTWVDAQVPEIVSASRSTDIPAFYARLVLSSTRERILSVDESV